jgi:hypothetical protein
MKLTSPMTVFTGSLVMPGSPKQDVMKSRLLRKVVRDLNRFIFFGFNSE